MPDTDPPPQRRSETPGGDGVFAVEGPQELDLNPNRQGAVAFSITNLTRQPVKASLRPRGLQDASTSWISVLGAPDITVQAAGTVTVTLNVNVPLRVPGGCYEATLDVVPDSDPETVATGPPFSFVVPSPAVSRSTRRLRPLLIGILVLVLLGVGGTAVILRKDNRTVEPPANTSQSTSEGSQWSGWEDLGGSYTSAPTVASWSENRLDVFAAGAGNAMLHRAYDGVIWQPVEDLGPTIVGAPAAVSWGPNRIDVFVRGTKSQLYQKAWDGSWTGAVKFGGYLTSSPAVSSRGINRLDIFYRGSDNALYHKWWDGSAWSESERLGGTMAGPPAVVSRSQNVIDVFFRGQDQHLYQKTFDGKKWQDLQDLGSGLTSDVAVSSWGQDRLDLFREGDDHTLQQKVWNGSTWSEWETIATGIDGSPAAVSWATGRIDVVARGSRNQLLHMHYA